MRFADLIKDRLYSQPLNSPLHIVRPELLYFLLDQLDRCLDSFVVAKTLSSLVSQQGHLKVLHVHRPVEAKYYIQVVQVAECPPTCL